jgi:hypothetical protein
MNSLWDIRIFLGLVPKESLCITMHGEKNKKIRLYCYRYSGVGRPQNVITVSKLTYTIIR